MFMFMCMGIGMGMETPLRIRTHVHTPNPHALQVQIERLSDDVDRLEEEKEELKAELAELKQKVEQMEAAKRLSVVLAGSGTTNPSNLYWEIMENIMEQSMLPMKMSYRAVGSSTGQKEFLGYPPYTTALNHFGSGDIPMSADRYKALTEAGRKMVHVPLALGAIAVFHSIPDEELGGEPLHLDACLLAKIFSCQIRKWNHPDILKENDKLTATSDILVARRVEGSSSTTGFTEYLDTRCPAFWSEAPWAKGKKVTGSTIAWPDCTKTGKK